MRIEAFASDGYHEGACRSGAHMGRDLDPLGAGPLRRGGSESVFGHRNHADAVDEKDRYHREATFLRGYSPGFPDEGYGLGIYCGMENVSAKWYSRA